MNKGKTLSNIDYDRGKRATFQLLCAIWNRAINQDYKQKGRKFVK